jgi:hypothetical protein
VSIVAMLTASRNGMTQYKPYSSRARHDGFVVLLMARNGICAGAFFTL